MRKFTALGVVALLTLCACSRKGEFPPEEVLRRAAQAVQELQSASFVVKGDYVNSQSMSLAWNAEGVLGEGGKQLSFEVELSGTIHAEQEHALHAKADVIVAGEDVYFRLQSLVVDPPHPSIHAERAASLIGTWYKLPATEGEPVAEVAPDPGLLRAQAQVIRVSQDRGLVRVGDHDAYSYAVEVDPLKLQQFLQAATNTPGSADLSPLIAMIGGLRGEMLIDETTFFVDRFRWSSVHSSADVPRMSLDMTVSKHNRADPVVPPQGAVLFDPGLLRSIPLSLPSAQEEAGDFPLLP